MNNPKTALISVSDKENLLPLAQELVKLNFTLLASGGTARLLRQGGVPVTEVGDYTGAPEMLDGRVKTLHPAIHAGILARQTETDRADMQQQEYRYIDLVVCNLYPFQQTVADPEVTLPAAVEQIDIGGVTLLRAAAKNHLRVTVVCNPEDYQLVLDEYRGQGDTTSTTRQRLALQAFAHTAAYDQAISDYLRAQFPHSQTRLPLRYGVNPHQIPAQLYREQGPLPLQVRNGSPGTINFLDALLGWPLVKELRAATGLPAAASYKHLSPAGAAVAVPLTAAEASACFVADLELSPLATAYARARGADRLSSFGDWVALSDPVDEATARLISREVSDGVIAPGYEPAALEILKKKKDGRYPIVQIDPEYEPPLRESRQIYGLTLAQRRNDAVINADLFHNIVTGGPELPATAVRDLLVATIATKYAQSNTVCFARNGQVIGIGAGQQSRIHCTRLAGDKADLWWLRQHPQVLGLHFRADVSRAQMNNAIDLFLRDEMDAAEREAWAALFTMPPAALSAAERRAWIARLDEVAVCSDAFFPFRDNIDRARRSGARYIIEPGGSVRDDEVIAAAAAADITLIFSGLRLFTH